MSMKDAGRTCRKDSDMKRKRLKVTASAIIAGLYAAGCTYSPADNEPVDIYGPPSAFDVIEEDEDPAETEQPDVKEEEDPSFDPGENVAEPLYGPPAGDVQK